MNKCPITYELTPNRYSDAGLAKLSSRLTDLIALPYSAQEQRQEAATRAGKMSIQGVQPKLSAKLSPQRNALEIGDSGGTYIIKPQSDIFKEIPENEDLTMKMAKVFGIEVPLTGLIYAKDNTLSYFIKRYDRYSRNKKLHAEDFAQLTGNSRFTKYNWSMEKLVPVIDTYCSFPLLEKRKLFRRVIFCFITGNEDMHLKNFSLITRNQKVELSPAYDLLNSSIAIGSAVEEIALPIQGKKSKIKRKHLFDYFGKERLSLSDKSIASETDNLKSKIPALKELIDSSFLSSEMKENYLELLTERTSRLI